MKKVILFPGQGAQVVGMGKDLYESNDTYKEVFDAIDAGLDFSLKDVCFEGVNMDKSEYVQPAIYAHSIALFKALGEKADICAGLSLGEYAALTATNMQDVVQGAQLVNKRGQIMDNAVEYGKSKMMSVLGADISKVEDTIKDYKSVWVANHLSQGNIVIAGEKESVEKIESSLSQEGIKTVMLKTSGPFHTPMLDKAADKFIELLNKADFSEPDAIIYSNYSKEPYENAGKAPELLSKQMSNRVRWHEITEDLISQGVTEFVEVGPSMVLSKMLKRRLKGQDVKISSVRNLKTLEKYMNKQKEKKMPKSVLVTGASGGIGQAIAIELASMGFDIGIHYRSNEAKANEVKARVEELGQRAILLQADLTSSEECSKIVDKCVEEFDSLYAVVNNAGITKDGLTMRMKDDDFTKVIDANLTSCFYITKAALPYLLKKRDGRIINISSVIGIVGNAGQSNYAASKAGIIGFTKSIAKECAARKVCANVVAPGYIVTPMTEILNDKVKEGIQSKIPLKRLGQPEDVAYMVGFLCSDKASYITGQVMCIDGGMVI